MLKQIWDQAVRLWILQQRGNIHVEDGEKQLSVNRHPQIQLYHHPVSFLYINICLHILILFRYSAIIIASMKPQHTGGCQYFMRNVCYIVANNNIPKIWSITKHLSRLFHVTYIKISMLFYLQSYHHLHFLNDLR